MSDYWETLAEHEREMRQAAGTMRDKALRALTEVHANLAYNIRCSCSDCKAKRSRRKIGRKLAARYQARMPAASTPT